MITQVALVLALCGAPARAEASVSCDPALASMRALSDPALGELRAGAPSLSRPLDDRERVELAQASRQAGDLGEMRAGAVSDRDLQVAGLVLLGVIVVAILL